jgi:hypothetical protein
VSQPPPLFGVLLTTEELRGVSEKLAEQGCRVQNDADAGTMVVRDGDTVVLRAIAKGAFGPWITMFYNSERITWTRPSAVPVPGEQKP